MQLNRFPVIDMAATGRNIIRLRKARGLTVRDIQTWFGFEEPQAVYKWQSGKSLPTVDNLYALSILLQVPMDEILVAAGEKPDTDEGEQQARACCSDFMVLTAPTRSDRKQDALPGISSGNPAAFPNSLPIRFLLCARGPSSHCRSEYRILWSLSFNPWFNPLLSPADARSALAPLLGTCYSWLGRGSLLRESGFAA